jgi:hypothetical protein
MVRHFRPFGHGLLKKFYEPIDTGSMEFRRMYKLFQIFMVMPSSKNKL